jgi:hypothetical protein
MPEIGDAPLTGDPCRDVVRQILRACQRDADISYHINPLTTTGERIMVALVATEGMTEEQAREALWYQGREKPRTVRLREREVELNDRVNELEELLDGYAPGWREREEAER